LLTRQRQSSTLTSGCCKNVAGATSGIADHRMLTSRSRARTCDFSGLSCRRHAKTGSGTISVIDPSVGGERPQVIMIQV
jgi:hypothetical protein